MAIVTFLGSNNNYFNAFERFLSSALLRIFLMVDSQIEAADKQLKATRQFLEDQAAEREQERDEFGREIEKLRVIVKEKDKDMTSQGTLEKEVRKRLHYFHLLLVVAQNSFT